MISRRLATSSLRRCRGIRMRRYLYSTGRARGGFLPTRASYCYVRYALCPLVLVWHLRAKSLGCTTTAIVVSSPERVRSMSSSEGSGVPSTPVPAEPGSGPPGPSGDCQPPMPAEVLHPVTLHFSFAADPDGNRLDIITAETTMRLASLINSLYLKCTREWGACPTCFLVQLSAALEADGWEILQELSSDRCGHKHGC